MTEISNHLGKFLPFKGFIDSVNSSSQTTFDSLSKSIQHVNSPEQLDAFKYLTDAVCETEVRKYNNVGILLLASVGSAAVFGGYRYLKFKEKKSKKHIEALD
jgi:hypothetical protein